MRRARTGALARVALALATVTFAAGCGDSGSGSAPSADAHRPNSIPGSTSASTDPGANGPHEDGQPRPASVEEIALVAPLAQDKPLLDWTVREVRAIDHGTLDVVCEKGPTRVILSVALASETGPEPPVQTERFAVFYSVRGERTEEGEKLARALAAVLDANKAVPVPPGLTVFVPRPRSL